MDFVRSRDAREQLARTSLSCGRVLAIARARAAPNVGYRNDCHKVGGMKRKPLNYFVGFERGD